jgi:hypothetical protein
MRRRVFILYSLVRFDIVLEDRGTSSRLKERRRGGKKTSSGDE